MIFYQYVMTNNYNDKIIRNKKCPPNYTRVEMYTSSNTNKKPFNSSQKYLWEKLMKIPGSYMEASKLYIPTPKVYGETATLPPPTYVDNLFSLLL